MEIVEKLEWLGWLTISSKRMKSRERNRNTKIFWETTISVYQLNQLKCYTAVSMDENEAMTDACNMIVNYLLTFVRLFRQR